MVRAFVGITAAAGESEALVATLRDQDHVREAHVVAGEFDIVVEVEGDAVSEVMRSVSTGIRRLEGVLDTRTYICLE